MDARSIVLPLAAMPSEAAPSATVCSRCRFRPALAPNPFCAACLLAEAGTAMSRESTGTAHADRPPGTVVGRYEIVELLGAGGFAEVYSTRPIDRVPGDDAPPLTALKIIKRGMDSREILARFQAEQRAVRALSHPSIVQLTEAGFTADGLPFFAMAQIDGLPVTEYCQATELPLRRRLELFLPLCDAVQHAHQKGVLHRDLKPANILVEETPAGPVPKVIDFGIAKALEPGGSGQTHVTQLGLVLGTPTYMSPEQAEGRDEPDTRSDIYALGAVLYELLTDCPPFDPEALGRLRPGEWSRFLRANVPPPPSARLQAADASAADVRQVRGNLDLIVRKAMAPDRDARYASAAALAEDVGAWLEDRPISARPPTIRETLRQFVRGHRLPVAVALALLLGVIATAGIGTVLAVRARRAETQAIAERNHALAAERVASEARERSEHQNYQAAIGAATIHLARNEPYLAAAQLNDTPNRLRGWEWGYLMAAITPPEAAVETALENPDAVAATPDGRFAAVAAGGRVVVVDTRQGRVVLQRDFAAAIERLALSEDGGRLAIVETPPGASTLHVFPVAGGGAEWSASLPRDSDLAWEPAGTGGALLLVSGNGPTPAPGRLARLDGTTGRVLGERPITRWKVHGHSLQVGPAGRMAVVENSYKDLEVFSLPDLRPLASADSPEGEAVDACLLDDRRDRLVVGRGKRVYAGPASRHESALSGELTPPPAADLGVALVSTAPPNSLQVRHLNWLPDGRWFAAGDAVGLVEGDRPEPLPEISVNALLPLSGGRALALLRSGRVEIRPERPAAGLGQVSRPFFDGDYAEGRAAAFTPDSKGLLFQGWPRNRLESVPLDPLPVAGNDPPPAAQFPRQPEAEWSVLPAVLADGTALVRDGVGLAAVRQTGGTVTQTPIAHTEGAWSADGSPDGSRLAVGVPTGVRLLDGSSHAVLREWSLPGGPFRVLWLAGNRTRPPAVAAISRDASLHYLPADGGSPCVLSMPWRVNGYYPAPLAFHRESGLLAGALEGGGFAVYDLRSLPSVPLLRQRCASAPVVTALGFTRHTHRLAVGTEDHRVTLWDWEQALPLLSFPLNSYCASVAFSPDGQWLAYTDYNPSLVLRRAEPRPPKE